MEQDGQVRDELVVARYGAPGRERPGRVRALHLARRGGALQLMWHRARAATRHEVRLRLSDGRRLVLRTDRARLRVPHVAHGLHARVAVRGLARDGGRGRAARRRI